MTESLQQHTSAAAVPHGAAAAASSQASVALDAAFRRAVSVLAHDLRNAIGALALQVEAVGATAGRQPLDAAAVARHADAAGTAIEGWADTLDALLAFARGRATSDVSVVARELAQLAPLRRVALEAEVASPTGLDPLLVRAMLLEVLCMLDPMAGPHRIGLSVSGSVVTLAVRSSAPPSLDPALEWVVQFVEAGGSVLSAPDALTLVFPAAS